MTPTYQFTYSSSYGPVPVLTAIASSLGDADDFTFTYQNNRAVKSPFSPYPSFGTGVPHRHREHPRYAQLWVYLWLQ